MTMPSTSQGMALIVACFVAAVPTPVWGTPGPGPLDVSNASIAGPTLQNTFVLPPPDALEPTQNPRLQSDYCGDLMGNLAEGLLQPLAGFIAILVVGGWCVGTLGGANELAQGDLEQGLYKTALAALLGGFVGWGVAYGLARQNQIPEPESSLWQAAGATAGAGTSMIVGMGALGVRMWFARPTERAAQEQSEGRRERRRPKPRSR